MDQGWSSGFRLSNPNDNVSIFDALSRMNGAVAQQHQTHHDEIENIERHEQPQGSHYIKQEPEFLPSSDSHVMGGDDLYSGNSFHSKHVCKVCGDRASGKHYGLYSCEGCKGFFKRTVRKDLTYSCRDNKHCIIDKRQRNRCQYCRYQKCLQMGMKREAVQGETLNERGRSMMSIDDAQPGSPAPATNPYHEMPIDEIQKAESEIDRLHEQHLNGGHRLTVDGNYVTDYLAALIAWTKMIPQFETLKTDDRVYLVQSAWNEITIADIAHRSLEYEDVLLITKNETLTRAQALQSNVEIIFERVITELVQKMKEMKLDRTELGCLKAIVLYNPDVKQLQDPSLVEELREKVYATLEAYAKQKYPEQPGRFAKLLLRLPALRSIGLKCLETMFLFKTVGDAPQVTTVKEFF